MGIPVGKLALYTACGGIPPQKCLPITLDVGTDNEELLKDPLYIGLRHRRVRGEAYDELLDEFMKAVTDRHERVQTTNPYPHPLPESERFLLETFNCTAAVAVAGLLAALRVTKSRMSDHTIVFQGAGEAAMGIAELIIMAMEKEGLAHDECVKKIWMVDSKGLIVKGRGIFASGSPFDPVTLADGRKFFPGQGNNAYVFPGVSLGAIACNMSHIPEEIFLITAETIAELVTEKDLAEGRLYPPLTRIQDVSFRIAVRVPLTVTLAGPEPLTSAMMLFLYSMKEAGKGPVPPKILFTQLCQKAPRFKGYQQQDSQELLHYLLDSVRMEENKRIKAAILKAFNNPTEKTADEETKRQVKVYGREGVKMNFVDRIFVGELTNTIMCEECEHKLQGRSLSTCHDSREQDEMASTPRDDATISSGHGYRSDTAGSQSDASDKDSSPQDSSNDADSEASESECSLRFCTSPNKDSSSSSCVNPTQTAPSPAPFAREQTGSAVEQLVSAVSKLGLVQMPLDSNLLKEKDERDRERDREREHQGAFQALSHSYTPASKECSVQSCLHQFTSIELLMGNNKLLCENCTERRNKHRRSGDKKVEKVYTSARKQMLISVLPPVVTLHLKRFHQAGMNLRKVNRHVDFPLHLDLAPFCSASCKSLGSGEQVLYSLYGIVEHSGSMRGGHYTAYVKAMSPSPGQWVYVSDTSVQTVPESRVLNSQAYLLFYEELL
ncbi:Ubiquitin carboxyl-terminal hydrolase 45 [Bagarius yarrelli]|uniref:NADP-dependent malic enzyme n=1 Tax=Bagarius yarrelli TaxID=175774 RepID=A0A556U6G5_BAGYA|nr:Ubiquitin carboxyl-terminal hydrolase 45 [Bagarius yarrelli]